MESYVKAQAEAATKLSKAERLVWISRGAHVFRRPGRRWTAAITEGQIQRAREQLADYQDSLNAAP